MDLPLSRTQARKMCLWLKGHYGPQISAALAEGPFDLDTACAIVCQETGIYLIDFIDRMSPAEALARCVFDASGDADGTSRGAFSQTTAVFSNT